KAGADRLAVEQHRAGPADADAAAFLGARQLQIFPQEFDQQPVVGNLGRHRLAVDLQADISHAALVRSLSAWEIFSAEIGSSVNRTPTASCTALAMAAPTATLLISPIARGSEMPAVSLGTSTVVSSGMSMAVGSLYSPRCGVI